MSKETTKPSVAFEDAYVRYLGSRSQRIHSHKQYASSLHRAARILKRQINPHLLPNSDAVDHLLAAMRTGEHARESFPMVAAALRRYAEMVEADFEGLFAFKPLPEKGRRLLTALVGYLKTHEVDYANPATYPTYESIYREIEPSAPPRVLYVGHNLRQKGLDDLNDWTVANHAIPKVTGLIVDKSRLRPGDGYFKSHQRSLDDDHWWHHEVRKALAFDWSLYIETQTPPEVTVTARESTIELEWLDRPSKGWIDFFPVRWFEADGTFPAKEHDVYERESQSRARARCDVSVSGNSAVLDYEAHAKFNSEQEMYLGVARILFADDDHTQVASLEWRPAGKSNFKPFPFRTSKLRIPDEAEYRQPTDTAPRKQVTIRERPGQATFRKKLKGAYNHTCCMSGCDVSDALEGAHIDAFKSKASDNLRNGLLLRRDIHTLFDRHLIAIDPETHVIHVAESIRTNTGYAAIHGQPLRLPKNPTHHPSPTALKRRWARFTTKDE